MQIVIDIPKYLYEGIERRDGALETEYVFDELMKAVDNGTPLPKHSRLIDADKLEYTCNSDECGMLLGCNHCQYNIITEEEIDSAPTIIEADKGEGSGKE